MQGLWGLGFKAIENAAALAASTNFICRICLFAATTSIRCADVRGDALNRVTPLSVGQRLFCLPAAFSWRAGGGLESRSELPIMASDVRLKEQLPRLTDRIVAGYKQSGSIHYLGHCPLPNYDEIVTCLEDLKEILYPGYRRREGLHIGNVTYHVGDLIDGLHDKLTRQIARALQHEERVVTKAQPCENQHDY